MFPAQPNRSLIDGLAVLQELTVTRCGVGTRELSRRLGLEPTRVNRLLGTLAGLGLARRMPDRKYTTGAGVHVLAAQALYASGLIHRALPVLEGLHDTGHVVALGVLWRDAVCYLYHGRAGMGAAEAVGTTGLFPALQSGIGHVLLAALDGDRLDLALGEDAAAWSTRLAAVRRQGWAYVQRSATPVHATLAVPVGVAPFAAVALAGRITRDAVDVLLPRLRAAAEMIAVDEARERT